jgi:hypothetical protein
MFISVLGILCGVFIAGDYFGVKTLASVPYFFCWVGVILDSMTHTIKHKEVDE